MSDGELFRRRNPSHWDVPTAASFVTVCLEGSIPARGLLELQSYQAELEQCPRPAEQTPTQWARWNRAPTTFWDRLLVQEAATGSGIVRPRAGLGPTSNGGKASTDRTLLVAGPTSGFTDPNPFLETAWAS